MSGSEPVGSVAEEAAKLLAAMHGWAGSADGPASDMTGEGHQHETGEDAPECRWCPLCQLVRMAKATSPEVRDHLTQAALSLALALKGLLEEPSRTAQRAAPLEKIDLTEE